MEYFLPQPKPKVKKHKRKIVTEETYQAVYERDKGMCRLCGIGKDLNAHHVIYRSERRDLINDPNNIILLCMHCHNLVHSSKKKYQPILLEMLENKD